MPKPLFHKLNTLTMATFWLRAFLIGLVLTTLIAIGMVIMPSYLRESLGISATQFFFSCIAINGGSMLALISSALFKQRQHPALPRPELASLLGLCGIISAILAVLIFLVFIWSPEALLQAEPLRHLLRAFFACGVLAAGMAIAAIALMPPIPSHYLWVVKASLLCNALLITLFMVTIIEPLAIGYLFQVLTILVLLQVLMLVAIPLLAWLGRLQTTSTP